MHGQKDLRGRTRSANILMHRLRSQLPIWLFVNVAPRHELSVPSMRCTADQPRGSASEAKAVSEKVSLFVNMLSIPYA